jgi:hypothetical protein
VCLSVCLYLQASISRPFSPAIAAHLSGTRRLEAKALIANSGLDILSCDELDTAALKVRSSHAVGALFLCWARLLRGSFFSVPLPAPHTRQAVQCAKIVELARAADLRVKFKDVLDMEIEPATGSITPSFS